MRSKEAKELLREHLGNEFRSVSKEALNSRLRGLRALQQPPISQDVLREMINCRARELLREAGADVDDSFELYSVQTVRRYEGAVKHEPTKPDEVYIELFEQVLDIPRGMVESFDQEPEQATEERQAEVVRRWNTLADVLGTSLPFSVFLYLSATFDSLALRRTDSVATAAMEWVRLAISLGRRTEDDDVRRLALISRHLRPVQDLSRAELTQLVLGLAQAVEALVGPGGRHVPKMHWSEREGPTIEWLKDEEG